MRIGRLKHRVTLEERLEVPDKQTGTKVQFKPIVTVWAQVTPVKGLVKFDTKQIGQGITHEVLMRYYPDLTSEQWLEYKHRHFRIRDVSATCEQKRELLLLCEEVEDLMRVNSLIEDDASHEHLFASV